MMPKSPVPVPYCLHDVEHKSSQNKLKHFLKFVSMYTLLKNILFHHFSRVSSFLPLINLFLCKFAACGSI